ncbi:MAG: ABC transporter permease, partial [Odoribacter sp.]|nr:ABC transporter permease [Odoribacter sp.]
MREPSMVMIPKSKVQNLYGNNSAIGQQLYLNGETLFTVAAVYEDFPDNSSFKNYFFIRYEESEDWNNWNSFTYILGTNNSSKESIQLAINDLKIDILDQIFTGLQ